MSTMKKYNIILVLLLISSGLFAQGVYNNGAKIVIGAGTTVSISGTTGNYRNETNISDGSIDLSGTLVVTGNISNNAATDMLSFSSSGSTIELAGTSLQTLGGTSLSDFTFSNLTVNNAAGTVFNKNAAVNGGMTFTNGLIDIGNNNFVFGPLSTVSGVPSASAMIVATGTGQVRKQFNAIGNFTFPVGDNNVTAKYSPVSLNFSGGTFAAGAFAGINLVNAAYTDPLITGSYLNRYWNVTQTGISGFVCNAAFNYVPADVVGTESDMYCVRISPTPSTLFDITNPALHQLTATGLTTFGTFTGAVGQRTLNLKAYLQALMLGRPTPPAASTMFQAYNDLGPNFGVGVADQITVEFHNATAYSTIDYTAANVNLSTQGDATITFPATHNGSYYITIKHRNSIETTSSIPVSFAGSTTNYDFSTNFSQAYGDNLKLINGVYAIFCGDVDNDGSVGILDMGGIENASMNFISGYVSQDVDGDGSVGIVDMGAVENNSMNFVGAILPPSKKKLNTH